MTRTAQQKRDDAHRDDTDTNENTMRRAARTAADIMIGGTALAADKAIETADDMVERASGAFRKGRYEARRVLKDARREVRSAASSNDGRPYEKRTMDELYALAAERDIDGRSSMRKPELIQALREAGH